MADSNTTKEISGWRQWVHGATAALFALWWGGFTFYASFVVPNGMRILGDHTQMGLITQVVTNYLNGIGSLVLLASLVLLLCTRDRTTTNIRAIGWDWFLLVVSQAVLIGLHTKLTAMIICSSGNVSLEKGFYNLHRVYLLVSTAIWVLVPFHYYRVRAACHKL